MAEKDDACVAIIEMEEAKCPECGAGEDELDFYVSAADGLWRWNCFACGHDWCSSGVGTEADEEDEEGEDESTKDDEDETY